MKKLLVVVGFQNDFVNGVLKHPQSELFLPRIKSLVASYSASLDDVVFLRDVHQSDYLHKEEGRHNPVPHCLEGSEGALFYKDLEEISSHYLVLNKDKFGSSNFFHYLEERSSLYASITFVGLDLLEDVLANAIIAKSLCDQSEVRIDLSASSSLETINKDALTAIFKQLQVDVDDYSKEKKGLI
jgi:nicotinamidase-related amidase